MATSRSLRPAEDQATDMPGKVKVAAFWNEALLPKEFVNHFFLTRANLHQNVGFGCHMAPGPASNAAVGLQPIWPPVKRPGGVKITHISR